MFKGAFQAFKELNKSVNGRDHSLWKSRDDLLENSAGQSKGNSSPIDKDLQEKGTSNTLFPKLPPLPPKAGIHPQTNELATVDSSTTRAGEWFGSNIIKEESQHLTEEAVITPTFQIPQKILDSALSLNQDLHKEIKVVDDREHIKYEESTPASPIPAKPMVSTKAVVDSLPLNSALTKPDRERTKHEEVSPASPIPNKPTVSAKVDNSLPSPSPTPTKSTTPAKSPSDDRLSPRPTDNAEQEIKFASPTDLTFTRSASTTALPEDEPMDLDPSTLKSDRQEKTATTLKFKGYINGVATFREESIPPLHTGGDSTAQNKSSSFPQDKSVRKMSSTTSFLRKMATLSNPESNNLSPPTPSTSRPDPRSQESNQPSPRQAQDHQEGEPNRPRRRQNNQFAALQAIVESETFTPKPAASPLPFGSSLYGVDSTFAQKMEEAGRLRRLQSQSQMDLKAANTSPTPVTKSQKHAKSSSEGMERIPSSSGSAPHTLLEDLSNTWMRHTAVPPASPSKTPAKISPAVSHSEQDSPGTSNSHAAELQALRDQLTQAMRGKQVFERELLRERTQSASERERFVRELRTLKQDNSVLVGQADQLTRRNDDMSSELKRAQTDLRKLTAEKRGWQEQLDTMHHKVVRAERQIRCLDHLTRAKLEARAEEVHGAPKRTKLALAHTRSSEEVISAVKDLNEEILQAASLLIENLDRTRFYGSITEPSNKAEKVVGIHATEMLKAQSETSAHGFRQLLMLVVMEVFLVHWCSAIIEGFYPKRPSFADLLVELSSHTTIMTTTASKLLTPFSIGLPF